MNTTVTIYDSSLGIVSKEQRGQCFLVDSTYRQILPAEEDKMIIAQIGKGTCCYAAYSNIFAKMPSEDVYPYQVLLPPCDKATAILTDNLNDKYVILTALVDGLFIGSRTYETACAEGDFRRFCSSFNIPTDAPIIEIREYVKPKRLSPFQEPQELLLHVRKKRTETILLTASAVVCSLALLFFGVLYYQYLQLTGEKEQITAQITELASRVPKENIEIFDKLDKDDVTFSYFKELAQLEPSSLASITADGVVFISHSSLDRLRGINKRVNPIDSESFFLPVDTGKHPVETK
jgi:hypothetical protein